MILLLNCEEYNHSVCWVYEFILLEAFSVEITGGRYLGNLPQRSFAFFSAGFISLFVCLFVCTQGNRSANSKPIWGSVVVYLLSHVQLFCNPMNCSSPGSSVQGFPRQEYWRGLPLFTGIFPTQGLNPHLLHLQADSLPLSHLGSPMR